MLSPTAQERLMALARKSLLEKNENDGSGVSTNFYRITESFGIKLTRNEGQSYMQNTFDRQLLAWQMGLGPYCFGFGQYTYINWRREVEARWGYITEIVRVHYEVTGELIYSEGMDSHPQIKQMRRRMGWNFTDCHNQNLGVRGRSRQLLCIDFGND